LPIVVEGTPTDQSSSSLDKRNIATHNVLQRHMLLELIKIRPGPRAVPWGNSGGGRPVGRKQHRLGGSEEGVEIGNGSGKPNKEVGDVAARTDVLRQLHDPSAGHQTRYSVGAEFASSVTIETDEDLRHCAEGVSPL